MKKYLALLAIAAVFGACQNEKADPDVLSTGEEVTEFGASIPEVDSKTYLSAKDGDVWHTLWGNGDAININGVASNALSTGDGYVGTSYARFTMKSGVSTVGGKYYYAYPNAKVSSWNSSSKTATITIPTEQTWVSGQYDPNAYVMVGSGSSTQLSFHPLMGLLKISPTAPAEGTLYVEKVRVEAIGGEKLSGAFTTDYSALSGGTESYVEVIPASRQAFGTPFTAVIPAQTYTEGLRVSIYANTAASGDGTQKIMVFSKQSSITVDSSTQIPLTAPEFKESAITLACIFKTSSSLGLEWSGTNAANNIKKPWRLAIYSDSGCNTLVVQHDIPADPDGTGVWKDQNGTPRFIVGGLSQGTTYYCKVTDIQNGVSSVAAFNTESFTPVSASSPSGSTLVAEDFSEIGWGPAWLGGYSGHRYAGWSPVNSAHATNAISFAAPTGVVSDGYYQQHEYAINNINTNLDYSTVTRLNDGWGYYWEGGFNGYPQSGFLRMGGKNANRSFVVCPALSITEGKYATVDVTVVVTHSVNGDTSNNADFGVFKESGLTLSNATQRQYTGAVLNHAYPMVMSTYGYNKATLTFRVNGVKNTDHLVLGLYKNVKDYNRFFLFSVKVDRVGSEYNEEIFDITDAVSLDLFRSRVAGGATSLNGNVVNDIDASSIASSWTPLADYTGTLSGNSKTITGLTKPFFDNLKGSVSNLTINSEISSSDAADTKWGVLAKTFNGGTVDNCTSEGSITYSATSYSANCNIGGLIGEYQGGTISGCHNSCSITFSASGANQTFIGGIVANNTISGRTLNNCHSTGGTISYTGSTTGGNLYIGGIVGYSTKEISNCTNAMTLNIGGTISGTVSGKFYSTGGIVGSMSADSPVTACLNTGNINWSQVINEVSSIDSYSFLGGVAGRTEGNITNSSNGGTVTYSGKNHSKDPFIGGVVGSTTDASISVSGKYSSASATNYGSVIINTSAQTKKVFCVGGVAGRLHNNSTMTATNNGPVTITKLTCTQAYIGGLTGYSLDATSIVNSGSSNMSGGIITVTSLTAKGYSGASYTCWIGGAVGLANGAVTANNAAKLDIKSLSSTYLACIGGVVGLNNANVSGNNSGNVVVSSSSSFAKSMYIGGIVGRGQAAISNCTNSGSVSNAAPMNDSAGFLQLGGIVGYNNGSSTVSSCHNTGDVSNTGDSECYLYVGGITSESDAAISGCDNTGTVSNSGNSGNGKPIKVGGIAGHANAAISSSSNGTSSAAGGRISNSGTSAEIIGVGGVVGGGLDGKTVSGCYNKGSVGNSGDGVILAIGGVAGWAEAATFSSACYNTGAVSNSGTASEGDGSVPGVRIGGLVGCAPGVTDLSGTSGSYHYNNGSISESSESTHVAVSGVCAFSDNTSSTFEYAQNKSNGDISIGTGDYDQVWVGGVVGLGNEPTIDHSSNAGDIVFDQVTTDQLWCGGVIGKWKDETTKTIQYCANSGTITTKTHDWSTERDLYPRKYACSYSYIGGIAGGGPNRQVGKTYSNCTSSGDINIYSPICFMIGGITSAVTTATPSDCTVKASITFKRNSAAFQEEGAAKAGTNNDSYVAGIVGYADLTSFSGLLFRGSIDTMSSNAVKAAGIVAYQSGGKSVTFTNCKVGGTRLRAAQSNNNMVGIFEQGTNNTSRSYTFPGCVIETGLLWDGDTDVTINSSSDVTIKMCAGPNCKLASGGTLPSVGSVTWPSIP